jgi:hypothetical protein
MRILEPRLELPCNIVHRIARRPAFAFEFEHRWDLVARGWRVGGVELADKEVCAEAGGAPVGDALWIDDEWRCRGEVDYEKAVPDAVHAGFVVEVVCIAEGGQDVVREGHFRG